MDGAKWQITNDMLVLQLASGATFMPSAKEIYDVFFKGSNQIRGFVVNGDDSKALDGLNFCKFPVELKVKLLMSSEYGPPVIQLRVSAQNQSVSREITDFSLSMSDYVIIDKTWYPFVPGDIKYIHSILKKSDITEPGKISLKQYLKLIQTARNDTKIVDDVTESIKHEGGTGLVLADDIPLFQGKLYPYQVDGYCWLKMISNEDAGCILGDQMGLGKTIQIIALLSVIKTEHQRSSLVITPPTLMENWRREIKKFAPGINLVVHKGYDRTGFYSVLQDYDVVITSYETVIRDLSMLKMVDWNAVVLDEAHYIKNPSAKRTIATKQLPRRVAVAVTGTPVQNCLVDLWSIVDFSLPGYLGNLKDFENEFGNDEHSAQILEQMVSPIILRRLVTDVAKDLPERIDIPQALEMCDNEIDGYEELRSEIINQYGKNASLVSLSKLRMYCTHPFLVNEGKGDPLPYSTKYQRLVEVLYEIVESGEKAIIFTSFSKMIDIITYDIISRYGIPCDYVDGRVPMEKRQEKIDCFESSSGSAVLVLNPHAAGVGLNITAANHVIHYNLEWNPAVEDQASARAYRRGQTRPVTVHRLFYTGTVEEIIDLRVANKRTIAETAVIGHDGSDNGYDDIIRAINISPAKRGSKSEI